MRPIPRSTCHIPLFATFNFDEPVSVEAEITPTEFKLYQNFPNPFNPSTTIYYSIPELSFVTLKVYDVLENEIATLVEEEKPIGSYEIEFEASGLPSGIYFYYFSTENYERTNKMILIK